jgi:hypothetical protein
MTKVLKVKHKISLDYGAKHKRGYNKGTGAEGFSKTNDHCFSSDIKDWCTGESKATQNAKPLF